MQTIIKTFRGIKTEYVYKTVQDGCKIRKNASADYPGKYFIFSHFCRISKQDPYAVGSVVLVKPQDSNTGNSLLGYIQGSSIASDQLIIEVYGGDKNPV